MADSAEAGYVRNRKARFPGPLKLLLLWLTLAGDLVLADEVRIAVASNFSTAMRELASNFERSGQHRVKLSFGSTGKHYAQIRNGAPFDAFFAADAKHPQLLEQQALTVPGSRFSYAIGEIVLWSPDPKLVDAAGKVLESKVFRYLAIANPKFAPYGKAAQQVLIARGVSLGKRQIRGENVAQAFHFVYSGGADLGFVAQSQLLSVKAQKGSKWKPPQSLYTPIEQQAVALNEKPATRQFMHFVRSPEGKNTIRRHGYRIP